MRRIEKNKIIIIKVDFRDVGEERTLEIETILDFCFDSILNQCMLIFHELMKTIMIQLYSGQIVYTCK